MLPVQKSERLPMRHFLESDPTAMPHAAWTVQVCMRQYDQCVSRSPAMKPSYGKLACSEEVWILFLADRRSKLVVSTHLGLQDGGDAGGIGPPRRW